MVIKLFKRSLFIVLVLLTVVFLNNVVLAQRNLSFLDSELKDKDKKALVKRIKTFTKKIRKARWNEVYELLSENIIGGRTKEEFILEMKEDSINPLLKRKVLGFLPKTFLVTSEENGREKVHVSGCIELLIKDNTYKYWGTIDAVRRGTDIWVFNSFPIVNPNSNANGPTPCN